MLILRKIGALTSKPYAFNARPWELKSVNSFDILDSFGSSIRLDYRDKEILRIVPRNSEWISDKVRFFYDGFKYKRFHYIYLRKKEAWLKLSLSQLFFFFKLLGCYFSFNEISFRFGDGVDLETIFSVKAISSYLFAKGMNSLINYEKKGSFRATTRSFFFKKTLFSKTDCIFLIGTNLRLENPILNAILRKQVLESSNLKVFVLGSSVSYNYYVKQLGNSLNILYSILQ